LTPRPQNEEFVSPLPPLWAGVVKYGIVVVTAVFYVTAFLHFEYTPDASYVSFRVASNIARGEGFIFNAGEPNAGTSGPIWSLIIAAGVWGGLDAPLVAKTFDLVFACVALFVAFFLAYLILRDKVAAFFAILLLSVDAWVLRSSASGLGYSLGLLLVVVVLWYGFMREYGVASFVCGFLILTAPLEGALLWAVMMVDGVAVWRREKIVLARVLRSTGLVLFSIVPWVCYMTLSGAFSTGSVNVGTFTASLDWGPLGESRGQAFLHYAASAGVMVGLLLLGHAVVIRRGDWRLIAPSSFPLLWALVTVCVCLLANPAGVHRTWTLVAPVVVIYGLLGLYYCAMFLIGVGRKSTIALFLAIVVSLVANQVVYRTHVLPEMRRTTLEMQEQVQPMASWLRSHAPPDAVLLVPFGGMIGWITGMRVHTSALLWPADEPSSREGADADLESLLSQLPAGHASAVVDRSLSATRLTVLGLIPLRTWNGIGGDLGTTHRQGYTVYVDSVSGVLPVGSGRGFEPRGGRQ
jgi:hypothetical protein